MSETPKKINLDRALASWPDVAKAPGSWEDQAVAIDNAVQAGASGKASGVADEILLSAPLGQIPEDGHNPDARASEGKTMTMQDRERDRRSLQDLAKMAAGLTPPPPSVASRRGLDLTPPPSSVGRPPEAKKDDSGIVDLAMAAASDPAASQRAQSTPLASEGLFDDEPASVKPPMSAPMQAVAQPHPSLPPMPISPSQPPPSVAPVSHAPHSVQSAPISMQAPQSIAPVQPAKKKGKGGVVIALFAGALVLSGAAAGGFMFLKHRANQAIAAAAKAAAATTVATNDPTTPPATTATVAAAEPTPSDPAMDPNALPTANAKTAAAPVKGGAVAIATKPGPAPAAPAKEDPTKLAAKDIPKGPDGPPGDLGKAMEKSVGPKAEGEQRPAAGDTPQFAPGSVPQKPSQGAVVGALGAVLPAARNCIGPDAAVSRATVTFASNGTVQSVNVSGAAAGKPEGECIKGALSKAKLAPFAEPTFVAPVTIRH